MEELNQAEQCQRNCMSSSSILQDDYQKKILTGKDISAKKAKKHCSDFKKLYEELTNENLNGSRKVSSSESCLIDILTNFCPDEFIQSTKKVMAKVFYQGDEAVFSDMRMSELQEDYGDLPFSG